MHAACVVQTLQCNVCTPAPTRAASPVVALRIAGEGITFSPCLRPSTLLRFAQDARTGGVRGLIIAH
jgi:hypothetical protein